MPIEPSLKSPGPEILLYLARHPHAQDTLEGIRWWVLEECIRKWESMIGPVVEQMVQIGLLETRASRDGRVFYRALDVNDDVVARHLELYREAAPAAGG